MKQKKARTRPKRGSKSSAGGWGQHLTLTFKKQHRVYVLLYAHLSGFIGKDKRTVQVGEGVALAGCTGNAGAGEPCGKKNANPCGGHSDHVHVELMTDRLSDDQTAKIDPVSFFGWSLPHYNNLRSIQC